ncbi:MAG TPA: DUF4270 family protein [Prolixibacteraceae bacterium]|nr:DUF4270 family protein [Prolixibacteraceae bacterium]
MERCLRFIGGLFLIAFLFSCNLSKIEEFELGQDFVDSSSGVVLIDTMNIYTSTVRFDSVITSGLSSLLVGGYMNGATGTVTCSPHFEMTSGSFTIIDDDLVYDSLVIKMKYDGYFIGDTTKLFSFNVKQLAENLELNDDGYLYNSSSFQLYDKNLGEARFYPKPRSTIDFNVRLSDSFGKEFFNNIINKIDTMQTSSYFKEYFKGIALVSNENQNAAAIGFAHDSIALRVYYHEEVTAAPVKEKTYFSFPVDASGIWFNQIIHNTTGGLLETISQHKNELQSTQTMDQTMIQAGNGIYTKIAIPGADYLKGYGKNVVFIGSTIQLTPLKDSYSDLNSLPDSLSVYVADRQNRITSQLSSTTGYIYANKIVPAAFDKLPYYEVDISSFFTTEIATGLSDNSLLIGSVASKAGTTINPIVFARTGSGKEIVKMHVYCYLDKSK